MTRLIAATGPAHAARRRFLTLAVAAAGVLTLALTGCRVEDAGSRDTGAAAGAERQGDAPARSPALRATLDAATTLADSVEELLRPVPLMRPGDEDALRRYSNAENLVYARRLGARAADSAEIAALVSSGRLVRLDESSPYWVLRDLRASHPYVTPETRSLLERLGQDFQARLGEMGLPPYRFEISSVLRTASSQAALRRTNVNAAAGTSAHEYGTTVDIAYSGYAAPARLPDGLVAGEVAVEEDGGRESLEAVARVVLERVAARKSRELKAILGGVLREAQGRGQVLVTLESLQPVYHITATGE